MDRNLKQNEQPNMGRSGREMVRTVWTKVLWPQRTGTTGVTRGFPVVESA